VLALGRRLAHAGFRILLYRRPGRPLPRSVDGPWAWPPIARIHRLAPRGSAALTVAPSWGVSAAPSRAGAFGRGGAWEEEARDIEAAYGPDRTIHVSLEEFARTGTALAETRERLREGGVAARALRARLRAAERAGEVETFRRAFRRFRAFDRPNVLHLFATFGTAPAFVRQFPEAVLTGPLWPGRLRRNARTRPPTRSWVWYASPASAEAIGTEVARALGAVRPPVRLWIRTPRPWRSGDLGPHVAVETRPVSAARWRRRFADADVRIVTGSRTLLEAIEVGGPFLYFNGVLASGPRRRRHRPEKILAWLASPAVATAPAALRRDLADFARGRRVAAVVVRAVGRVDGWARFPGRSGSDFPPPFDDAGSLAVAVARALDRNLGDARAIVARVRARSPP